MRYALALSLTLLCASCATASSIDQALADARVHANDLRADVNQVAALLNSSVIVIDLACSFLGDASVPCSTGRALHVGLSESVKTARVVIDAYDATALGYEQVKETVRLLEVSAAKFEHHLDLIAKAIHALDLVPPARPDGSGAQPSGPDAAPDAGTQAP